MSETTCRVCGKYNGPKDSSDWCRCPRVRDSIVSEDAATPPSPDLDAVVARVRSWLDRNGWEGDERVPVDPEMPVGNAIFHGDLRALLAAVSRPAEARHDCERWRAEGMGCAECNHTAGAIREYWDDPIRRERDILRAALAAVSRKPTP